MSALAEEIRRVRTGLGLTLEEFGERTGLPLQTLHAYETGRAVPPADRFLRILHASRKAETPFRVELVAREMARVARAA